ncbi:MAG: hypothetical protein J7L82_01825 [Staphylothermus sp.]|nr:hypothetical protein [Staphylothermus sp.]
MNSEEIAISIIHYLINRFIRILTTSSKTSTKKNHLIEHYKNMLYIVFSQEKPTIHKTYYLLAKYVEKTTEGKKYYTQREVRTLELIPIFRKRLREELHLLKLHGAESILSRTIFVLAGINKLEINPDLDYITQYLDKIDKILLRLVPPKAYDSRLLELLSPNSKVGIILGFSYTWLVTDTLIDELNRKGIETELIILKEKLEDNISTETIKRYIGNKDIKTREITLKDLKNLEDNYDILVILNYYYIFKILDDIIENNETSLSDKHLLVFNPMQTPIGEILGNTPIVMTVKNASTNLKKNNESERT